MQKELTDQKKHYDELTAKIKSGAEESEYITSLSNALEGNNSRRINFKNYVLGAYLKKVATNASQRLRVMSDSRYRLEQVFLDDVHKNKQAGLDLEVFDAHSGKNRSVKSLSGGEKFMASICLALGLADVIQSRNGGIELDSIFIDEGFGSLSEDALQNALLVIDEIQESRLVGVISHVDELKARIPDKLLVIKGNTGSRIRVEAE
ncbi:MAG: hypothetical protein HQK83_17455 [Fibrobacteria bacterium]|nr:hypothetical protein [Fibrobacteria bacterium]